MLWRLAVFRSGVLAAVASHLLSFLFSSDRLSNALLREMEMDRRIFVPVRSGDADAFEKMLSNGRTDAER